MDTRNEFLKIMREQSEIGLATSINDQPNVRIVNFYYNAEENKLYFSSFKGNEKIAEFSQNHKVAFTTVPHQGNAHVKARGTVRKSSKGILDLKAEFAAKIDGYGDMIEQAGDCLDLYEIECPEAVVILDFENKDTLVI